MELVIPLVLLATAWLAFKIYNRHAQKCADKIPGPKSYPIIGSAHNVLGVKVVEDYFNLLKKACAEFEEEGIMKAWLGPLLFVIVHSPKYVEAIATSPNATFKGPIYSFMFGDVCDGLFVSNDEKKWKELKKPLNKLLTKKLLNNDQHQVFIKKCTQFVNYFRKNNLGKEVNVLIHIQNTFTDILTETHFGVESYELQASKYNFSQSVNHVIEFVCPNGLWNYIYRLLSMEPKFPKDVLESKTKIFDFYEWIFEERKKKGYNEVEEGVEYYSDFLLRRQNEKQIMRKDIYREISDVAIAGSDTAAVALSAAFLFLAMYPEIQEEAYQEQMLLLGDRQDPTFEDLSSMSLLTRVVKDSLRLTSTAVIYRSAKGDVDIGDYIIPKGTTVGVFVEKIHSDPKYWEKPDSFHPDHFLPENEAARPKHAFLPFGFGLRKCPVNTNRTEEVALFTQFLRDGLFGDANSPLKLIVQLKKNVPYIPRQHLHGSVFGIAAMKMLLSYSLRSFKLSTRLKYEDITPHYKLLREFKCGYGITFTERNNIS